MILSCSKLILRTFIFGWLFLCLLLNSYLVKFHRRLNSSCRFRELLLNHDVDDAIRVTFCGLEKVLSLRKLPSKTLRHGDSAYFSDDWDP